MVTLYLEWVSDVTGKALSGKKIRWNWYPERDRQRPPIASSVAKVVDSCPGRRRCGSSEGVCGARGVPALKRMHQVGAMVEAVGREPIVVTLRTGRSGSRCNGWGAGAVMSRSGTGTVTTVKVCVARPDWERKLRENGVEAKTGRISVSGRGRLIMRESTLGGEICRTVTG